MKVKIKYVVPTVIVIGLMIFITLSTIRPFDNRELRGIYDNNNKIVAEGDSYSYNKKIGGNSKDTDIKTNLKFILTGMDTLWEIDAQQEATIEFNFISNVTKGRFKVVLINPENEISNIVEGTETGSKKVLIKRGKSRIKVIGDGATGKIQLTFSNYEGIEFTPKD